MFYSRSIWADFGSAFRFFCTIVSHHFCALPSHRLDLGVTCTGFSELNDRELSQLNFAPVSGHFPRHIFKCLLRCLVADARVAALSVVEDLNIFKDFSLSLGASSEALAMDQLLFQ
jgi:hypothetical protein